MRHSTFFWFFLPTGAAMLLFIAFPLVSVVLQSIYAPHPAVLIEVENCTPLVGCTTETTIDQDATRDLREREPLGRFVGLEIFFDRGIWPSPRPAKHGQARKTGANISTSWATCPFTGPWPLR